MYGIESFKPMEKLQAGKKLEARGLRLFSTSNLYENVFPSSFI
jgi:hypothetical protein